MRKINLILHSDLANPTEITNKTLERAVKCSPIVQYEIYLSSRFIFVIIFTST